MSVYEYASAIRITFDSAIESDPCILLGETPSLTKLPVASSAVSGESGGSVKARAFDGATNSEWGVFGLPAWISVDLGAGKRIAKVRVYTEGFRVNEWQLQGSSNNTDWTTITSGTWTVGGWQTVLLSPVTEYRYWRVYVTSSSYSQYVYVQELEFYEAEPNYEVGGWTVTGQEYDKIPGGVLETVTYQVRKVTKAEDDLSVILWLKFANRMKAPVGDVTVQYQKAYGNLTGPLGAQVDDFTIVFTPTDIQPVFSPNAGEYLALSVTPTIAYMALQKLSAQDAEYLALSVTPTIEYIHVDDLPE